MYIDRQTDKFLVRKSNGAYVKKVLAKEGADEAAEGCEKKNIEKYQDKIDEKTGVEDGKKQQNKNRTLRALRANKTKAQIKKVMDEIFLQILQQFLVERLRQT